MVAYLKVMIAVSTQFIVWQDDENALTIKDKAVNIAIFAFLLSCDIVFVAILMWN